MPKNMPQVWKSGFWKLCSSPLAPTLRIDSKTLEQSEQAVPATSAPMNTKTSARPQVASAAAMVGFLVGFPVRRVAAPCVRKRLLVPGFPACAACAAARKTSRCGLDDAFASL